MKKLTRSITEQLDEDLLGIRMQEVVMMLVPILVFIFVAGQITGSTFRKYNQKISELFVYKSNSKAQTNTLNLG